MDWADYSFVVRGQNRRKVLLALEKEKTPTQVAEETKLNLSHVSRALKELTERGLVECVTPEEKVGRIYRATPEGETVRERVDRSSSK
jgi:DNA-binding MarR family transcriptional regulator